MTLLIPLNNSVFVPICAKKHMKNWRKTWTSWTSLPFNSATSVPGSASWPRSQLPPHSWWEVMDVGMEQNQESLCIFETFWKEFKTSMDCWSYSLRTQMSPALQLSMPHFLVCAASGCILCRSFALPQKLTNARFDPNDTANTSHWQPKPGAQQIQRTCVVVFTKKCLVRTNAPLEAIIVMTHMYKSDLYLRVSDLTWTLGSCWHPNWQCAASRRHVHTVWRASIVGRRKLWDGKAFERLGQLSSSLEEVIGLQHSARTRLLIGCGSNTWTEKALHCNKDDFTPDGCTDVQWEVHPLPNEDIKFDSPTQSASLRKLFGTSSSLWTSEGPMASWQL